VDTLNSGESLILGLEGYDKLSRVEQQELISFLECEIGSITEGTGVTQKEAIECLKKATPEEREEILNDPMGVITYIARKMEEDEEGE